MDFDAATDGPVLVERGPDGVHVPVTYSHEHAGGTVTVEEIILCESCVRSGAEILSIEPRVMEDMALKLTAAEESAELWQGRAEALKAMAAEWQAPVKDWPTVPKNKPTDPQKKADALAAAEAGAPIASVARLAGVSDQAVRQWLKKERV